MLEGRHFHIHFTNHTPGNKLSTQYRVNEWMGSIFLTLTSVAFWGDLLAHLPQFPGVRPIPTPAFPPLWFSLGVLPSPTLPLLPKLSWYYESWRNCQEMEVSFGISFILISPPQMVKLRSVKKLARSKTSYHAGVTNCEWLSAQRHLQTQGMKTQAHRCTHRHGHTERHAEDYWKCHQLRNVLKVTFLSLYKTGVLQLHQPNYFSSNRDECH